MSRSLRLSLTLTLILVGGCFPPDDGIDPPTDRINFPVGLALSSGEDRLYVANSDFDLQYNAGTVQVYDAAAIRDLLPTRCRPDQPCKTGTCENAAGRADTGLCMVDGSPCAGGAENEQSAAERFLSPGFCRYTELTGSEPLLLEAARISPFVTDLAYALHTDSAGREHARLLMPVRGDATVHWADVEHDALGHGPRLSCGQENELRACDDNHRRGDEEREQTQEGENLPTEPFSLAVSKDGSEFVVTHQTQGAVSLFRNADDGPELLSVLSGLPLSPMGIAAIPKPALTGVRDVDYQQGYLVSFRQFTGGRPAMELLRSFPEHDSGAFMQRAGVAPISVAPGFDLRGIAIDASERQACEETCECTAGTEEACESCLLESECSQLPLSVFVANRSPSSLLVGKTRPSYSETFSDDLPNFSELEPLRGGPSRVWIGNVTNKQGELERRVFVVTFDSRFLYIYNPEARSIEHRVSTGRGPHAIAIDDPHALLYLAHFTDSYLGVLDLDQRHSTYGQFLLNVGEPSPPRSAE